MPMRDTSGTEPDRPRYHPARRLKSFGYALRGIWHAAGHEVNFQIQLAIAGACAAAGLAFGISTLEWAVVALACGALLAAELVNTALEELLDHLAPERSESVGRIKDLAAGSVLTVALAAAAVFALVFAPRVIALLQSQLGA